MSSVIPTASHFQIVNYTGGGNWSFNMFTADTHVYCRRRYVHVHDLPRMTCLEVYTGWSGVSEMSVTSRHHVVGHNFALTLTPASVTEQK